MISIKKIFGGKGLLLAINICLLFFLVFAYFDVAEARRNCRKIEIDPTNAKTYRKRANCWSDRGEYDLAIEDYSRAIELKPDDSLLYRLRGLTWQDNKEYDLAIMDYNRALELRPDYAAAIANRGYAWYKKKEYDLAIEDFITASSMDPSLTSPRKYLPRAYYGKGKDCAKKDMIDQAFTCFDLAIDNDPDYYKAYRERGMLWQNSGRLVLAISEFSRAIEINPKYTSAYRNLAMCYLMMGDIGQSKIAVDKLLTLMKDKRKPKYEEIIEIMLTFGVSYLNLGHMEQAAQLLNEALPIVKNNYGMENQYYVTNVLAIILLKSKTNQAEEAILLLEDILPVVEKTVKPVYHVLLAAILNDLKGYSGKTAPNISKYFDMKEGGFTNKTADSIMGLLASAYYCYDTQDYDQAESILKHALTSMEKKNSPKQDIIYGTIYGLLGEVYLKKNEPDRAMAMYGRCIKTIEKYLIPKNLVMQGGLDKFATISAVGKDYVMAHSLFKKIQLLSLELIDHYLGFSSEEQRIVYFSISQNSLYKSLSLVAGHLHDQTDACRDALDFWLKRKGIILEVQKRYQESLVESGNAQALQTFRDLTQVRARLSHLVFSGLEDENLDHYQAEMDRLEKEKLKLEEELTGLSRKYARQRSVERADCLKVAERLPPESLLIEIAKVPIFDFSIDSGQDQWLPPHYLAFILYPGQGERVHLIDLGAAKIIDDILADLRTALGSFPRDLEDEITADCAKLYRLVFAPLESALGSTRFLFISPDGDLNLIPFEMFLGPNGRFLVEDYTFNYLASGRDVIGFGQGGSPSGPPLLVGDPDYELMMGDKEEYHLGLDFDYHKVVRHEEDQGPVGKTAPRITLMGREKDWSLPQTKEEVETIARLLLPEKAEVLLGPQALEQTVLRVRSPRVLHLATHGFFFPDQNREYQMINEAYSVLRMLTGNFRYANSNHQICNPLLRAGLFLAGAKHTGFVGDSDQYDGVLTAEEVLNLRLQGTDLVVLSACETGLGDVKSGEGVYGLRRAFLQAGTKGLVMSMWRVTDEDAMIFMKYFYTNMIKKDLSRCQALRQAILQLRNDPEKAEHKNNPFFWGPFVYLGEP